MALLDELEGKIKLNPYAREFYQLALEYQKLGKFSEAKAVLIRGLERNQGNFQARLLLTKILVAEGNFKEAKNQVERVLLIVPDNVAANHLAAEISEALGDRGAALKYYRVVELFEPEREGIKEKISELSGQGINNEKINEEKMAAEVQNIEEQAEAEEISSPQKFEEEKIEEKEESKEKVEEIISEEENIEEVSSVSDFPQIKEEENLSKESGEESGNSFEEQEKRQQEDFTQSDTALEDQSVFEIDKEAYEDVGEDTLTDLIEDTLHQKEKEQEQPEEEMTENKEEIEEKESSETIIKEEPESEQKPYNEEVEEGERIEEASSLSTATLAELYEKQGYPDKAIEIYQHILLKDPDREEIKKKIEKLKKKMLGMETSEDVGVVDVKSALRGKRIEALKTWLKRIREADDV